VQGALISLNDLRTPAILTTSVVFCYGVSCLLALFELEALDLAADVFLMLTYCSVALIASWLLLRYGTKSSDVVVAIDHIANFFFALVLGALFTTVGCDLTLPSVDCSVPLDQKAPK